MKEVMKILVGVVAALVVLLVAFVVTLPMTIAPIVKTAASVGGPKVLGVPVSVGDVKLSPLAGRLVVSQLVVGNPQGFSDKPAFAVDKVDVALNLRSLLSDTIVVKRIAVDSPAISYESKDGTTNFDAIQANAKKSESEEKAKKAEAKDEKKAAKKVVIELFTLSGGKVSYSSAVTFGKSVTLPLPPLTLKDIGKESGGASPVEAVTEVLNKVVGSIGEAVTSVAGKAGDLLKGAAGGAGSAAKDAANSLKKLFK